MPDKQSAEQGTAGTLILVELPTAPTEKSLKVRLATRYQKKLIEFAELPTCTAKVEFLKKHEQFGTDFRTIYTEYVRYLEISVEREKLQREITEMTNDAKDIIAEAVTVDKAFHAHYKRLFHISRKLNRRLKYRLRPNYFDNYLCNDWIKSFNEDKNGVFSNLIAQQIDLIIIRQVKRLKLYQFSTPMDDLLQEIRVACLTAVNKFDPSKGKPGRESFNYFSHICKKAGFMITLRHTQRRKQETPDSDIVSETLGTLVKHRDEPLFDVSMNDRLSAFYDYFHKLFDKKERMQLLLQIMLYYILNVSYFTFKKNEFVKYACSYGFTPAFVNKFLNIMKSSREKFDKDMDFGL